MLHLNAQCRYENGKAQLIDMQQTLKLTEKRNIFSYVP